MKTNNGYVITSSPQIHDWASTARIMWSVSACLAPAGIWGVYIFGIKALIVILVSIGSALVAELLMGAIFKKFTLFDGSAFLTGLLVGYNMPPTVPLYVPLVASFFAIGVVKWTFGGLGANWMNPALGGRVFVFFSWTGAMTTWLLPRTLVSSSVTAVTGATPLGFVKTGLLESGGTYASGMEYLSRNGYPQSGMDEAVRQWFGNHLGINLQAGFVDLFIGNIPGCIGEVSALLLILGSIYLFIKKIITWDIPVAFLGTFSILIWIFGGVRYGNGMFSGDIVFHLFTGGLVLAALYMATDMVTSPLTMKGRIIYGIGIGFFAFLIRIYGSFPEGASLAVILMNIMVPLINRFTGPKRFGMAKGKAS
ncbi:MAG TPA: RnfABCDGE type electron transport complex subunit D [Spirochaetia bacterium]|nr:RnfABCDGE type electron transport complex subunit D [Spirochaetia bacterium]